MIEAAIRTKLAATPAISVAVANRLWLDRMLQGNELACIVYQRISTERHPHMTGSSGLVNTTFQIDCWSTSAIEAKQLGEYVRIALDGYDAEMGDYARVICLLVDERDMSEPPETAGEKVWYRASLDFTVAYDEETS